MALESSPLMGANPSRIQIPPLVAPSTLAQAAQMNPMQAMLAQYGLQIPTQAQVPQNFMFSDRQAPEGFPNTRTYGAGFGAAHPALATGIENGLLGAAMAPGGMPTAGQNIAQVAGSLTGVPQWRLQRRIGMTLAPLELAGSMQNILSQQAQAQGALATGIGNIYRGQGYMGMGLGRQMEAEAQMRNAEKLNNVFQMWQADPKQAQAWMDANADMIQKERLSNPLFYLYSSGKNGPQKAADYAKLMGSVRSKYGAVPMGELAYRVLSDPKSTPRQIQAMREAIGLTRGWEAAAAKAGLFAFGSQFDPYSGNPRPGGMPSQEFQQQYPGYFPGAMPQGQPIPFPGYQSPTGEGGPDENATPENPIPGFSNNQAQPFGAIP